MTGLAAQAVELELLVLELGLGEVVESLEERVAAEAVIVEPDRVIASRT